MSASMAEVLEMHNAVEGGEESGYCAAPGCWWFYEPNGDLSELIAAHQAEQLAANGYGKLEDALLEAADEFMPIVARSVLIESPQAIFDATVNRGRDWLRERAINQRRPE